MALIVEDGTGLSTAESYDSVANAVAYFAKFGGGADFLALTVAAQEIAMRNGTRYIDQLYHLRWKGHRVEELQALDFPRYEVEDNDGFLIDSDEIPNKLKEATSNAAQLYAADNTVFFPMEDETSGIKKESGRVEGAVSESVEYTGRKMIQKKFPLIDRLLSDFVQPGNMIYFA